MLRALIQRVSQASVRVNGQIISQIQLGWVILVGFSQDDAEVDASYLAGKIVKIRGFSDGTTDLAWDLKQANGQALVVSQFTLYGDCRKGRRPSFSKAASADTAKVLYDFFLKQLEAHGVAPKTGQFQAQMSLDLTNDGPFTLLLDSEGKIL